MIPLRVTSGCIGCGQCVMQCPTRCLMIRNGKRVYVSSENCSLCGHCFAICPVGAIEIFNMTADQCQVDIKNLQNIDTIIKYRRSIRKYNPEPLQREVLEQLVDFTKYAPSACNFRPLRFLCLSRHCMDEVGAMIAREMSGQFPKLPQQQDQLDIVFRGAPHCIVIYVESNHTHTGMDDAIITMTQLELLAQSKGIGTFWAGMLKTQGNLSAQIKQRINLQEDDMICGCLGIGMPALKYKRSVGRIPYHVDFLE
ncbi:Nitroreductase [Hexamita inflata]|uniref:Nitroreductase n=2 Tax=Hexamita inflata TaxID=28002 RepID=A0AA86PTL5_9EUKA|nr:Nitroreductase [Hexamita inflata]